MIYDLFMDLENLFAEIWIDFLTCKSNLFNNGFFNLEKIGSKMLWIYKCNTRFTS